MIRRRRRSTRFSNENAVNPCKSRSALFTPQNYKLFPTPQGFWRKKIFYEKNAGSVIFPFQLFFFTKKKNFVPLPPENNAWRPTIRHITAWQRLCPWRPSPCAPPSIYLISSNLRYSNRKRQTLCLPLVVLSCTAPKSRSLAVPRPEAQLNN